MLCLLNVFDGFPCRWKVSKRKQHMHQIRRYCFCFEIVESVIESGPNFTKLFHGIFPFYSLWESGGMIDNLGHTQTHMHIMFISLSLSTKLLSEPIWFYTHRWLFLFVFTRCKCTCFGPLQVFFHVTCDVVFLCTGPCFGRCHTYTHTMKCPQRFSL